MKHFNIRPLLRALCAAGVTVLSVQAIASGFQLFEQDGASVGNYHAGYAAEAADASTAFYNPAGITRIKNQQIVLAGIGVATNIKYQGTVSVSTIENNKQMTDTAQGGVFAFVPALHYVAPLTENTAFGFSVDVPFGMKVYYGRSTPLRYVSTITSVTIVDISPTYAFKVTDKISLGIGPDIQPARGSFNQMGAVGNETEILNSDGINSASDTAYGFHLGGLYEFSPYTRVGLSYHSKVVHHLTGTSVFTGSLAVDPNLEGPTNPSGRNKLNITLPPYTALSFYHRLQSPFAVMASVIYTQWDTIQNLVLQDVAGVSVNLDRSSNIVVTIPQYYHNTWNISLGGDYFATDKITLRSGIGYDQTPVSNENRNVQMPDNDRVVIAFGGHYQASKAIGLDVGYMHLFIQKAHIDPPAQVSGFEITNTSGSVKAGADVFSAQLTWNIA